jgi:hypothetical protein
LFQNLILQFSFIRHNVLDEKSCNKSETRRKTFITCNNKQSRSHREGVIKKLIVNCEALNGRASSVKTNLMTAFAMRKMWAGKLIKFKLYCFAIKLENHDTQSTTEIKSLSFEVIK